MMNVHCPHCGTQYRIDPRRVPEGGIRARCARCGQSFPVRREEPAPAIAAPAPVGAPAEVAAPTAAGAPGGVAATPPTPPTPPAPPAQTAPPPSPPQPATPAPTQSSAAAPAKPSTTAPAFGALDPHERARRFARALVSDIAAYHAERLERSRSAGTLRADFRDEVLKSWEEYVMQVGAEMAHQTTYFRDALNDILGRGEQVF